MNTPIDRPERPATDRLHPVVYGALVSTVALYALAAWLFAADGYTDHLLAVVTGFAAIATGLPFILSRVRRIDSSPDTMPFRDWLQGRFATWQDDVKGANAAIEIVLPLAAIAVGMLAIGIVMQLTEHGLA
jgi:hypothetical protein